MNNGNSSKQVLLSVLGIAVLVIAVVGVSFAFFTYSKTGENQLLTTGTIFFQFTDGDQINLKDQFPTPDTTGAAWTNDGLANSVMSFTVVGHDSSGKGIDYTIKAVPGDAPSAETIEGVNGGQEFTRTQLKDDEVKIYLKQISHENGTAADITYNETYKKVSDQPNNTALNAGVTLGTGHITATDKNKQQTDKYELRMWISSDCTIGDSGADYTSDEFAQKYYAIKIKIDAATKVTP